ncbi:MAG: gamma-glutamyltransferase [Actinomycetota bacterium]
MKPRLAAAAGSVPGAQAAANVARAGGNAVDACLAASIMAWVAEPFFGSIGGSGFVLVRTPSWEIEIFDGNTAMPHTHPAEPGQGLKRVYFPDYADGMYTGIGGGSIGVPGILAAARRAWELHGRIEWEALFADAVVAARDGLPLSKTASYYLSVTWDAVWCKYPSASSIFAPTGEPLVEGDMLIQAELAEALELVAERGPEAFYSGELARELESEIRKDGGFMTVEDLSRYEPTVRHALISEVWGWRVDTNPPPAVGGAVLVHMLALLHSADLKEPTERLRSLIEAQRMATGYRRERYGDPTGIASAFQEAIDALNGGGLSDAEGIERLTGRSRRSQDTTHGSAADSDGYVCSITESNGYGAGLVVHGMLLNNSLGEEELNPLGVHGLAPGMRCHSNMAPTIASGPGIVVGLGSPGADRIVGAIAQTLMRMAVDGDSLEDAVAAPRAHLDPRPEGETLCFEPGLPGDQLGFTPRPYDDIHMFFGAVQAASVTEDGTVNAVHDPRRSGGHVLI